MENMRGAALMALAMLGFAIEDMLIKQLSGNLPAGQILVMICIGGALIFGGLAVLHGDPLLSPVLRNRGFQIRFMAELIGTAGFVSAIVLIPLSTASAILQATPLVVTLGAAVFLGEKVGWRRWAAILAGLCGVLLIIRPGTADFHIFALGAVVGVLGLAARDLATRRLPVEISSRVVALYGFVAAFFSGLLLLALGLAGSGWQPTTGGDNLRLALALLAGVAAYYAIVLATRIGEMSVIAPYRYTRLVFALIIGMLVFGERPDALTLLGAVIVVTSGVYTLWREARLKAAFKPETPAL